MNLFKRSAGRNISHNDKAKSKQDQKKYSVNSTYSFTESILDNLYEGCQIVDFDLRYIYINKAAEKHFRIHGNELKGTNLAEALTGFDNNDILKCLKDCVQKRVPYYLETKYNFPDGNECWFDISINPVPEGATILSTETTTYRKVVSDLKEKDLQLNQIVNSGITLLWTSGRDKLCNYFNKPWLNFTGRTLEQELGNGWAEGVHPDDLDSCFKTYTDCFDKQEKFDMEYRLRHCSGEYRWIRDIGTPFYNSKGEFEGYIGYCYDITTHKNIENDLRTNEEKYRYLFANNPQPMWIVDIETLAFLEVNKAATSHYGFSRDEFLSMTLNDVHPSELIAPLHEYINEKKDTGKTTNEWQHLKKNKEPIIVEIASNNINFNGREAKHIVIKDITKRRAAESELLKSRTELTAALSSMTDAVSISDTNGNLIHFNDAFASFHKFKNVSECSSKLAEYPDIIDVFTTDMKITPLENWAVPRALKGETGVNVEYILRRKDTGETWFGSYCFSPIYNNNKEIVGSVVVGRDITSQKKAEKEIYDLNRELESRVIERTRALETANKELEAFSYSVSHDLRAPLRSINGFTQILIEDYSAKLDQEGKRICSIIQDNSRQMGQLIDDLLAFSRLGRVDMNFTKVNMNSLIHSVSNNFTDEQSRQRLDFSVEVLPDAYGDPSMLKQVWANLISNAIKYSSKNNISKISIYSVKEDNRCVYCIKDNGVGFDMAFKNKLFGVFQRLHGAKEFEGTGVGLAIVQRIVKRHNGDVWAEGEVDKGAVFYFSLPCNIIRSGNG